MPKSKIILKADDFSMATIKHMFYFIKVYILIYCSTYCEITIMLAINVLNRKKFILKLKLFKL